MSFNKIFSNFKQDIPAGIVVFFVAVPLCLGIALASGAPLFSGLIAGMVGGIIVGSVSNSALGVSGPAAGLAVVVLSAITTLGSFELFLTAVVLAGLIQIIMGLLKGGVIGYYFPSSVIKGMLSGIGIIIILKQIPHAVGYDKDYEGDLDFADPDGENTFSMLGKMMDYISPGALIVCLGSVAILLLWDLYLAKKFSIFKLIQGPLVAVVFGIVYQLLAPTYFPAYSIRPEHLVNVPVAESADGFIKLFTSPDFSNLFTAKVWIVAATLAVIASLETLLCVEATDKLDPQKRVTSTNRELIAQGIGNSLSGLIGGLPVTQVIVRSSANIQSGAQSKFAGIVHGLFLLICVTTIPFMLNKIPLAVLASILFVVGYKLAKPALFKQMYKLGWSQFLPFIVTILGIVFTDLLKGIAMGVVVALVILLKESIKNSHFMHQESNKEDTSTVKIILSEEVTFLNKGAILKALNAIEKGSKVTIDMSKSVHIDYDVIEIIENYRKTATQRNIIVDIISNKQFQIADY